MTEEKGKLSEQFEDIFKKEVRPLIMRHLKNDWHARSILYTIEPGRNRFRAGLAYLLSGKKHSGIVIGAASEIAWAAILILDDIGDNTKIRRGKDSSWQRFGLLETSHAATLGFLLARQILQEGKIGENLIQSLEKNIEHTLRAQIEQGTWPEYTSQDIVLQNYSKKTALGRWPIEAAVMVNDEISNQDKKNIRRFSEFVAIAAQIKNDLDDIIGTGDEKYEAPMKDLQEKVLNYPTALFLSIASIDDKRRFLSECWGQKVALKTIQNARELLDRYDIFQQCVAEIEKRLSFALASIRKLSYSYRRLLTTWAETYRINQKELQKELQKGWE